MSINSELINLLKIIYNDFDLTEDKKNKLESRIKIKEIELKSKKEKLEFELEEIKRFIKNEKKYSEKILKEIKK